MNKLKLQWKIFGFLLGFCALLLAILWIFQTFFLSDMYKSIRKNEIEKSIVLVEENINNPMLEDILYELELTKEITVKPTQNFTAPVRSVLNKNDRGHQKSITRVQEFVLADGSKISLTFYAFVTPVDTTISTLKMQLLIITGIMVFLAILLAIIISKRISKPIEQLNQSAKMLAVGNYEIEFQGEGYLEIKELSNTLNIATMELSKVERMRRELMANISHDLRTPLALIYSYAEMMNDFPDEITSEQSQIIMDETKRLTSLVNDMLDISNFEAGTTKLNKERFNLTESLKKTINRMQELVKNQGFQLEFKYDEDAYLCADEVKIIQVFYNLLINAITHSVDAKTVIVNQIIKDDVVKIEVIDYGEGVNQGDLPYIWERYYTIDKKHNRPIIGSGLGLSIVKKVIEMHDGAYGVESEIGKSSIFWFSLNKND
ncbi:MAG: HAMP domain-containing histidine kinase [Clostridia bacterium]|nr:HAMP domain-containing histidine kinase [Clostridia bacterium]